MEGVYGQQRGRGAAISGLRVPWPARLGSATSTEDCSFDYRFHTGLPLFPLRTAKGAIGEAVRTGYLAHLTIPSACCRLPAPEGFRMRTTLVLHGLFLFAAVACACGDKLMLVMGARLSRIKPPRPALILAYPGQTASATLIRDLQLQPAVKKSGHKFQLIEDPAGLETALRTGKFDLVITDIANANELNQRASSAPSKPVILPVAFRASKEDQAAAQKKYHCLLKAPANAENYLVAIDEAMDWKLKATSR